MEVSPLLVYQQANTAYGTIPTLKNPYPFRVWEYVKMGIFESAAYGNPVDLPHKCREHPLLRWRREQGMGPPKPMPRDYSEWLAAEDRRLKRL